MAETSKRDSPPAGRLQRPAVPNRPETLADVSLADLTSEVLARIRDGAFTASQAAILLGCELACALPPALNVHNNRFSEVRYRDMFRALVASLGPPYPRLEGTTVVELGSGSINPYGFLFLLLMLGAERGVAVDLDEIQDMPRALRALSDLAAVLLTRPGDVVGVYPVDRGRILRNIASFDVSRLHAGDLGGLDPNRLSYRRESVVALSLADASVDSMVSIAFLEHVPDVDGAIREMARVTKTGGTGVHVIDASDHRRYTDPTVHPLEFLADGDDGPLVHGSNRLRPFEFVEHFESNGFEVVYTVPFERADVDATLRERFVEPYRSMANEQIELYMAKLFVRRV